MTTIDYSFQQAAIDDAVEWALTAKRGDKRGYTSPTGSGKSYCELGIQDKLPGWWILTSRLEIARGLLSKRGEHPSSLTELIEACWRNRICTPIRFRNAVFNSRIQEVPGIIFDEAHHAIAESWYEVWLASGMPPCILFTATWFRGTPRSTAAFINQWGDPIPIITLREAAERGVISIPTCTILPLVDDDLIELSSTGEFDVTSLEDATADRLEDAAKEISTFYSNGEWDRPTCICVPTTSIAERLCRLVPGTAVVTAKTPDFDRQFIFNAMKIKKIALIQISVVGEGVDLPIRRLIDLAPCNSPVKWLQQLGRATRPSDIQPEYICTNRNLARHCYLLDGLIPMAKIVEAQTAFEMPSKRTSYRAMGLESLGRFTATNIKLKNGLTCSFYVLVDTSGGRMKEYACLVHPVLIDPIWATRDHTSKDGVKSWGHWRPTTAPKELRGFVSQSQITPTEKMINWYKKCASWHGLDPDINLTRKSFSVLPFCVDLGVRFK